MDRHSKTFSERGHEEGCCAGKKARDFLVGGIIFFDDVGLDRFAPIEEVDHLFTFPAAASNDVEFWGFGSEPFGKFSPEGEQEEVIFSGLDGAEGYKERGCLLTGKGTVAGVVSEGGNEDRRCLDSEVFGVIVDAGSRAV